MRAMLHTYVLGFLASGGLFLWQTCDSLCNELTAYIATSSRSNLLKACAGNALLTLCLLHVHRLAHKQQTRQSSGSLLVSTQVCCTWHHQCADTFQCAMHVCSPGLLILASDCLVGVHTRLCSMAHFCVCMHPYVGVAVPYTYVGVAVPCAYTG